MNEDVIDHIIKFCENEVRMCEMGNLIHEGGKESALATYARIIQMLIDLRDD